MLHPLLIMGGPPGFGKSALLETIKPMFRNLRVVELRELIREETEARNLKAILLTSQQHLELMENIREKIQKMRESHVVLLVSHFAHPFKEEKAGKKEPLVHYDQWVSYIGGLPADAYIHLDATVDELMRRNRLRKEGTGKGSKALKEPPRQGRELLLRHAKAELVQSSAIAREKNKPLYRIPVQDGVLFRAPYETIGILRQFGAGLNDQFQAVARIPRGPTPSWALTPKAPEPVAAGLAKDMTFEDRLREGLREAVRMEFESSRRLEAQLALHEKRLEKIIRTSAFARWIIPEKPAKP